MESAEHAAIPDTLTLRFPDADVSAGPSTTLLLPGGHATYPGPELASVPLTYGQMLALGGDFYGRRGPDYSPISDAAVGEGKHAADEAFMTVQHGGRAELQKILSIMAVEQTKLGAAHPPAGASAAYAALGDELSMQWNQATGGGRFRLPAPALAVGLALRLPALAPLAIFWQIDLPIPQGRYLQLATKNFDHFGADAVAAYRSMHAFAIFLADFAARTGSSEPTLARALLERAYLANAFADHFLTDLFSAGHLRTPRRRLYDVVGATGPAGISLPTVPDFPLGTWMSGMLSRFMHDEDCHQGLLVHNQRGDSWTAYGDKRLFDDVAKPNLRLVREAVQASIDEVYDAFARRDPTPPAAPAALRLTPDLAQVSDPATRENPSPLFVIADGTVACRNSLTDTQDYSWTSHWWGITTLAELIAVAKARTLIPSN